MRKSNRQHAADKKRPFLKPFKTWEDACPYCDTFLRLNRSSTQGTHTAYECDCGFWHRDWFTMQWHYWPKDNANA